MVASFCITCRDPFYITSDFATYDMATLCIASDCVTCKYQNSVLCHAVSCTRHNSSFFPVTFFVLKNVPEHFSHVATQAGFELASIRHVTRIVVPHD